MPNSILNKSSAVYILGLLLLVASSVLLILSYGFHTEIDLEKRPVLLMVSMLLISSVLYLLAINFRLFPNNHKKALFFIFITGLLIRVVTLFSVPMLEDDYFRSLGWKIR